MVARSSSAGNQAAHPEVKLDIILSWKKFVHLHQFFDGLPRRMVFGDQFGREHPHAGLMGSFSEVGAGNDGVKSRDAEHGMGRVDDDDLQIPVGQGPHASLYLQSDVVVGNVGQVLDPDRGRSVGDVVGFLKPAEFGKPAGHVIGFGVEITGQLGRFGQRPAQGLFRVCGGTGRPDDFTGRGEGGRIIGENPDGGNPHFQGKVRCGDADAGASIFFKHLDRSRIGD